MSEKYNEYCMKFSNEELKKYMIEYLIKNSWNSALIRFLSGEGEEIEADSSEKIETIVFDGDENLFINFYGIHTSIFAYDVEVMFIDEHSKGIYTSSDVFNNAVYEGNLREMSHEQMLQMFSEFILCFMDATGANILKSDVPKEKEYRKYNYYDANMFTINIQNGHTPMQTKIFENITINY